MAKANNIKHFIVLNNIKVFLLSVQNKISQQTQNGWNQNLVSNCLIDISIVLDKKDWFFWQSINSSDSGKSVKKYQI